MDKSPIDKMIDFRSWEKRIPKGGRILEVGSGGSAHSRATILCDKYLTGEERSGGKLITDRPIVLGDGEKLPFKDDIFDYSISIHVIEHSDNPELFLNELTRVSKKGYIETPSILWEQMQPWREFHKWFIFSIDNKLIFKKKENLDNPLYALMSKLIYSSYEIALLRHAFKPVLNVSFEWDSQIEYLVEPQNANELLARWSEEMIPVVEVLIEGGKVKSFFKNMTKFTFKKTLLKSRKKLTRMLLK